LSYGPHLLMTGDMPSLSRHAKVVNARADRPG
jgi:hypothetical protein